MDALERCRNCDAELRGAWCHQCGQRVLPRTLGLGEVIGEAFKDAFSADGRLARTIGPFFFRPGLLVAEYAAGRRVRYSGPVRLYLFALLVGFLAFRWTSPTGEIEVNDRGVFVGRGPADAGAQDMATTAPDAGAPDAASDGGALDTAAPDTAPGAPSGDPSFGVLDRWIGHGLATLKRLPPSDAARLLADGLFDAAPTAVTLMVPLFALLLKLLFPRRPYVLHLLLSLNLHALALILFALAALIGLPPAFVVAYGAIELHQLVALRRVYRAGWPRALASAFVLFVAHLVLFGLAAVVAIGLALASF